ncbi:MAG TPA: tetratricopeptide repeat protein [Methanotrichaceae archaeon]|nr:tetratricopeptide repeat protein [Methanotrichaceae archaeon]
MKILLIPLMLAILISSAANAQDNTSAYWASQGSNLIEQYKYDDALKAYDRALEINESYIAARAGRSEALWHLGRYNESLVDSDKALKLDPNYVRAWVSRGVSLHGLADFNGSRQAFDRAIEVDPNYAMAWNDEAWLFYKYDMYQDAIDYSDRAISRLSQDLAATLDTKAMALAKLGRNEEALQYIDKSLELTPDDSIVWTHRGDILKALGNQTGSEEAYARAKELPEQVMDESSV